MNDQILGAYKIGDLLGYGSFGEVYKALHLETSETYAIKFIKIKDVQANPKLLRDIQREVQILSDIEENYDNGHPNIVRLYDHLVSKDTGDMYLIMELIEGGDLGDDIGDDLGDDFSDDRGDVSCGCGMLWNDGTMKVGVVGSWIRKSLRGDLDDNFRGDRWGDDR